MILKIDKTLPSIDFSGNHVYSVLDTVDVTCTAADALSGIDTDTCGTLASGPAYSFGPGYHAVSASATDKAGNTRASMSSFTVTVSYLQLCALTEQFSSKKNENDLCYKLTEAQNADAKGKLNEKQHKLAEYMKKVQKDVPKAFTAAEAVTLIAFAQTL